MTDHTEIPFAKPQQSRLRPVDVGIAAVGRALEPAPQPRPEQQKVGDLVQLAGWVNAIGFLDLMELAKSITDSDADPNVPAEIKLAKALATWARATLRAAGREA